MSEPEIPPTLDPVVTKEAAPDQSNRPFLRKRTRDFSAFYRDHCEGEGESEVEETVKKQVIESPDGTATKSSRWIRGKYKTRNPHEKALLRYFAAKEGSDVLDYDELLDKGFIFDKPATPVNPHSLRDSSKRKRPKHHQFLETFSVRPTHRKERKASNGVNLLKIHMENRRNSVNPVILDSHPSPHEEQKNDLPVKNLITKQETPETTDKLPSNGNQPQNLNSGLDYEKMMMPKANKMMEQTPNPITLPETEKAMYQRLFYNKLMHFNDNFCFNPYYNANLLGMPERIK